MLQSIETYRILNNNYYLPELKNVDVPDRCVMVLSRGQGGGAI